MARLLCATPTNNARKNSSRAEKERPPKGSPSRGREGACHGSRVTATPFKTAPQSQQATHKTPSDANHENKRAGGCLQVFIRTSTQATQRSPRSRAPTCPSQCAATHPAPHSRLRPERPQPRQCLCPPSPKSGTCRQDQPWASCSTSLRSGTVTVGSIPSHRAFVKSPLDDRRACC